MSTQCTCGFCEFYHFLTGAPFLLLECIPLALAENCGLHPINTLTEIKAKQVPAALRTYLTILI
jgi:hypothetical protein